MKKLDQYLVVDDDKTNNLICRFTIQRFNKNAVINLFTYPQEALQFIRSKKIEHEEGSTMLFLDINMPTMSGFEFLEEFRKLGKEVTDKYHIFILTSSIEDLSSWAEQFPMVKGFLSKPLKLANLQDIHQGL